ncbi:hypothetical protein D3C76_605940 [compost metagenome]
MLLLRGILRRLLGLARQLQGQLVLTATLQHPDHAHARAGVGAVTVQSQCGAEITAALALLAHLEQQLVAAPLQPVIAQRQAVDLRDDARHRLAGLEQLLALVEEHAGIDVLAAAQASGIVTELDLFIGEDAQVRQNEFGPVLVKIAEEHQAQAIAQAHDCQAEQAVVQRRTPVVEGLRLRELLTECRQPVDLFTLGLNNRVAQALKNFRLEQHFK